MKKEIEDARIREQEEAELKELLNFCTIPTIEDFSQFIEEHRRTWSMQKLGEASYSEVYAALHARTKQSTVLKIMPFGRKDMEQASIQDISNELKISKTMMRFDGFVDVVGAYIVKGEYPEHLLTLWDQYADLKESENERPDFYDEEQKFCIVMLQNGGTDLEHFKLKSWREAATVFWRVAKSIAKAEQAVEFEHRDLHWGNIVLDRKKSEVSDMIEKLSLQDTKEVYAVNIQVTIIDYTLSRARCGDEGVVFSSMDDPALYNGRGDYQFDIYRFVRNSNQRRRSGKPTQRFDWSLYVPRTNTLWLHYLAERLIREKNLTEPRVVGSGSNTRAASRRGGKAAAESSQAEIDAYRSLDLVFKLIDPRKRRFGAGKKAGGGVVAEIGTAGDLVAWGREEGIVYE
ncbi:hypothetical protein BZA70DRAFT_234522 [Myxozyma melibiosi]|uniref:non-specific serine/threonine protein kinase n=1 Tax=Myxozyma melibiosi TaxID=54550 RepID=A0ABR1FD98_9ASCO